MLVIVVVDHHAARISVGDMSFIAYRIHAENVGSAHAPGKNRTHQRPASLRSVTSVTKYT